MIDNVKLRVRDEGNGPAVILVHGAYGNLNLWDSWAASLREKYRVIRFDGPPEGLSGRDEKGYSHARLAELIGLLADRLGIEKFAVGGTSRGGQAAFMFAANNPSRVTHLLLTQTPVYNYPLPSFPLKLKFAQFLTDTIFVGYRPHFYWRQYLGNLFEDQTVLTRELVQEYTDFSNRIGHRQALADIRALGQARNRAQNERMIRSIAAPTLLIATPHDNVLSLEHQKTLFSWLNPVNGKLVILPRGGHFPSLELGAETADIVKKFLDEVV